ncbi:hypothetical protein [Micromonospora sp. NPDC049662]|uniref:hypothetical protein n=1 Tax=Micromonospora sp. NPDC049662 TaxID=3155397 RepID=UPI00341213F2
MTVTLSRPSGVRPAAPARTPVQAPTRPADDVAYLHACGLTHTDIDRETGLDRDTIARVCAGQPRVSRRTTLALAAARLAWTPPAEHILAVPAARRLQALAYIGHAPTGLARRLDQPAALVWEWTTGEHRFLPRHAAAAVAALYQRLCMTEGPSVEAARYARAQGWASELAWDEGAIDDPTATPLAAIPGADQIIDPVAIDRALAGDTVVAVNLTRPEVQLAARVATQRGFSAALTGELLCCTSRTIQRIRTASAGLPRVGDLFVDYYAEEAA